jgi:glycosyltransferase involved in cell wall biosynthesis
MRILLLDLGPGNVNPELPAYMLQLQSQGHCIEVRRIAQAKSGQQILSAFRASSDMGQFDLVVTNEYFCAFGLCLRSLLTRSSAKLAVIGFNVSRRYLSTRYRLPNKLINGIFRRLSLTIVHSTAERDIFRSVHDLPVDQIRVVRWGFDLPVPSKIESESWRIPFGSGQKFVSMVGRNNRDFDTLIQALDGTGVPAVLVASSLNGRLGGETEFLRVVYDAPLDKCLEIMRRSTAIVTLLKDESRGAGHITIVSAMHLAKPQVFSDAAVLRDYVQDGVHGVAVPIGDADRVRQAVLRLLSDAAVCERYAVQAQRFACDFLSNAAFQNEILQALCELLGSPRA